MILSLVSTIYYHQKYVTKRDTLLLRDVNLNNAVDSLVIDQKLQGLKMDYIIIQIIQMKKLKIY